MTEKKDKEYCLQEALRINPNNENARTALYNLQKPLILEPSINEIVTNEQLHSTSNTVQNISKENQNFSKSNSRSNVENQSSQSSSLPQSLVIIIALILTVVIISVITKISTNASHNNNPCVVITKKFAYPDYQMGYSKIGGDIQNNCDHTVSYVKLKGNVFDNNGVLIGSDWVYADNNVLSSGQSSYFEILIFNATNLGSYSVEVTDWNDK
jgi:hypothetical protein